MVVVGRREGKRRGGGIYMGMLYTLCIKTTVPRWLAGWLAGLCLVYTYIYIYYHSLKGDFVVKR